MINNTKLFHRSLLAISLGSALTIISCGSGQATTKPVSHKTATVANTSTKSSVAKTSHQANNKVAIAPKYAPLAKVVNDTKVAVNKGDFASAKTQFSKFEGEWAKVEDGVKKSSATSYGKIETDMTNINNAFKKPSKATLAPLLDNLNATIATLK